VTLSSEQKNVLTANIGKNYQRRCPWCDTVSDWVIKESIQYDATPDIEGCQSGEGQAIPTVVATCSNCSFVAHFNARQLGLVE